MNENLSVLIRVLPFLVIIIIVIVIIKIGKVKKEDLYLQNPVSVRRAILWGVFFLALILTTEFSLYHLGLLELTEWNDPLLASVIKIIGIVILAPIAEELVFRGLILFRLKKLGANFHLANVIQAVIFLMLHSLSFENTFTSNFAMAQIFIDAILFGYAKEHTTSIYTPIAMHASGNFIAVLEKFI